MKISIITPSFNLGRFLPDAIESVKNQTYPLKEHLIFDAESTDSTLEVLNQYKNLPHLAWISEPDEGQSDAINKGFKAASGDIVAWLNADDYYQADVFSKIIEVFEKYPDVDIIYGDTMFVDQHKKIIRYKRDHQFDYNTFLYYGCYIQTTSTFFRRRIVDSGYLLNTTYRSTMDYEYFLRLANAGFCFKYIPEVFGTFRWHGQNVSLDSAKQKIEANRVLEIYGKKFTPSFAINLKIYRFLCEVHRIKRRYLRLKEISSKNSYLAS